MNRINRAIAVGAASRLPIRVWQRAHTLYPAAVADAGLYGAAFFGHAQPASTLRTTNSVWRGCIRRAIRDLTA